MQHNSMVYRGNERGRNMGVGPMRSRPMDKRHDTSPYSGVLYLSPPPPDTWRRTNSDSALHQSVNEACQSNTAIPHRRGSDAYQHTMGSSGSDTRDLQYGFIERPRSSCEIPRVPGINVHQKSQPPEQQRSLPNLTHADLLEEHSSSTPFSNNHLSVPVNCRFLHTCKGVAMENSTSTSQQDLQSYSQQPLSQPPTATSHTPAGHYIYQPPHSPVPPQSLKTSQQQPQSQISQQQSQHQQQQSQQQLNSLSSYRSSQQVSRPSPQSSPSLTLHGSPLSHCNPSASPSPTGHPGSPNLTSDSIDQNSYFVNQEQAAALQMQQDFEQFTMMDGPVPTIETYMNSPSHATSLAQSEVINVGGELSDGGAGYFSTSSQMPYQSTTTTTTTTTPQLTPQTPNTPTIILTDFSGSEDLTNSEFVKDFGTAIMGDLDSELFPSDDALRQGLDPIDVDGLQMLTDPTMVISDPSVEADFRLDRL